MKAAHKSFDKIIHAAQRYVPQITSMEEIASGSNNVFKLIDEHDKKYLFKEYINRGTHSDSEPELYKLLKNPDFLRKQIAVDSSKENYPEKFGLYEYIDGITLFDIIRDDKLVNYNIAEIVKQVITIIRYFTEIPAEGFGKVDLIEEVFGDTKDWIKFLTLYHESSIDRIKLKHPSIAEEASKLLKQIPSIIGKDEILPVIIPCDLNTKNILITQDNKLFLLSGAIMAADEGYGFTQFLSHLYKTPLADEMIKQLKVDKDQLQKLHLYCSISNYNVMAFVSEYTDLNPESSIPWGNSHSFSELLGEHMTAIGDSFL